MMRKMMVIENGRTVEKYVDQGAGRALCGHGVRRAPGIGANKIATTARSGSK